MADKAIDLNEFVYAKQRVGEAEAAQKEEMAALKEEIEGRYQLKERQRYLQVAREIIEDSARRVYIKTKEKTIKALGGKINIAVKHTPMITNEDALIAYLKEQHPGVAAKIVITTVSTKHFGDWWKAMDKLGESVPGVEVSTKETIRITVDKDFVPQEPQEVDMPDIDMSQVEEVEF